MGDCMLLTRKLKRKILIDEVNDFWEKYKSIAENKKKRKFINDYLVKLEKILNKYECEYDNRFVTYGRRNFLMKEFLSNLNEKKDNSNFNYLEVAFGDLYDYIMCDTWITASSVPDNESVENIIKEDNAYREDGIVCKQEKEILLDMISELKNVIKDTMINDINSMNIYIESSSWSRGSRNSEVINHKYKIKLNKKYVVKTRNCTSVNYVKSKKVKVNGEEEVFSFVIDEIGNDYIIIRTNTSMSYYNDGTIDLHTKKVHFKIKVNEVTELVTQTMDYGDIFKISLLKN